ncbi:O-acetyl-ADP-ribose deacetylase (regulator of RNase III) [Isoptericola jiangsuensis]|uniref:O-acetyl-ADP-ribose deacetylase (Regulator of RNase III) n=1 Tax=Isoptericola jiangsuensis TaxID=548579 RepID=A0A2A9F329_9MICO|nr:O-acetyl-ADP-ribose deacetylase [Isoptericola jiangsuensis]PFG44855.1 O-acetyl-ADP-ribose deacetylase (regulator of RNase III) [Isoptericola jiangsuensis]
MRITAEQGDITTATTEAIVNAANSTLLGGGGVDGAIHAAAGPRLLATCQELRRSTLPDGLDVGDAVVTPGFDLSAAWVVHTVGPNRHRGQTSPRRLASCFTRSLDVTADAKARTVAFPAVGAGVYGWDPADVARIAVDAVRTWHGENPAAIDEVRFVLFTADVLAMFEAALTA